MDEKTEYKITFTFKDDGSSLFDMDVEGAIYANQFLMLGSFCEFQGKQMLNDQRIMQFAAERERLKREKIMVPSTQGEAFRKL